MNTLKGAITWNELKYFLPVLGGLVTIIFYAATLNAKIDAVSTQGIDTKVQIQHINDTTDNLKTSLALQGQDIAIIKNILQHNGLTRIPSREIKTVSVPGAATITYIYSQPIPEKANSSQSTQPSNPIAIPTIVCVMGVCL